MLSSTTQATFTLDGQLLFFACLCCCSCCRLGKNVRTVPIPYRVFYHYYFALTYPVHFFKQTLLANYGVLASSRVVVE